MPNKILAAVLLVCVICWSLPQATVAAVSLSPVHASTAETAQEHSCCPRIHPQARPSFFAVLPPANMPCDSRHPCCLQQGQENGPALPSPKTDSRPDLQLHMHGSHGTTAVLSSVTTKPYSVNPSELCLLLSTVLRI